jgi:hypothetical protein
MADIIANIGATAATASAAGQSQLPRGHLFFGASNIAAGNNADPALATPVAAPFCGVATIGTGVSMIRSGSITGLSVKLTEVAAGSSIIAGVYRNGTLIPGSIVTILAADDDDEERFTYGEFVYDASDVIDVRIRTGSAWSALTADAAIVVEFTSSN